jgi:hypothetical protein
MNLFLLRGGYPPVAVRPEDRLEYIRSLKEAPAGGSVESSRELLYRRLDETLEDYLRLGRGADPGAESEKPTGPARQY